MFFRKKPSFARQEKRPELLGKRYLAGRISVSRFETYKPQCGTYKQHCGMHKPQCGTEIPAAGPDFLCGKAAFPGGGFKTSVRRRIRRAGGNGRLFFF